MRFCDTWHSLRGASLPQSAKKDLWVSPTPRGLNPRLLDPFTFLLVFSREEWENRQNR